MSSQPIVRFHVSSYTLRFAGPIYASIERKFLSANNNATNILISYQVLTKQKISEILPKRSLAAMNEITHATRTNLMASG